MRCLAPTGEARCALLRPCETRCVGGAHGPLMPLATAIAPASWSCLSGGDGAEGRWQHALEASRWPSGFVEAELPIKSGRPAGTNPSPQDKHGLICGVSAGDGRIACGIPMYRDKQTSAPYIMPLYTQPLAAPSKSVAEAVDPVASRMEAAASVRLRQEALDLLRRFLDAAPAVGSPPPQPLPGTPATSPNLPRPGGGMYYPVPSKKAPAGIQLAAIDLGPISRSRPTAGTGGFL